MDLENVIPPEQEKHTFRLAEEAAPECIEFLRDLVTIPSPSRGERLACERVMREMEKLGYRDVHLDEMGNVLGRFGSGPRRLAFDAHIDTVGISDPMNWKYDPFRGVVSGGILFGRGASDQKGGLAAVVYGVALAARIGIPDDFSIWVAATVNGEDCVGLAWQYLVNEADLRPEVVVVSMPSHLGVCHGQRGRMEIEVLTQGESTHGSQPDRGTNAIYLMGPIVSELAQLHGHLPTDHPALGPGSIAVTEFTSRSPSLTAIPNEARIHIDRRLTIGETMDEALEQIRSLPSVQAADAEVRLLDYNESSWRGFAYPTDKVFPAWETPADAASVEAAVSTARQVLGREPRMHRSKHSSSGCATAGLFGIPTVGFGPADEVHSHTVDDQIPLAQLQPSMAFYAMFPEVYFAAAPDGAS
ncbi:MAG: YgeY family selenium metabolism-linked hydrolase [Thermoanaerobaculales bacterium]|jgi:putative selenium metabolism hydrolase|nr:YgeY family selenium metabolism-linked hydrolase [Thermoanaerobaculales bacterium]